MHLDDFNIIIAILALVLSLVIGRFYIPFMQKKKLGQAIREDGPQSHLVKSGTPTMGGVIFILASGLCILLLNPGDERIYIGLFSMFAFGLIGLIDDGLIIFYKRNEGLSAKQKFAAQVIVALVLAYISSKYEYTRKMIVPFGSGQTIDLSIMHYPLIIFVILGTVNAVNLTDGLDGLATQVSIVGLLGFAIGANILAENTMANFSISVLGALLGFLYYNKYPAKIFMGDVGSLALGGVFATIAIMTRTVLYLPFFAFIFVIETLSVIIQVTHFKRTGRRIFLMSPLHHHFEEKGWHETKVVKVFTLIASIVTIIGLVGLI